MTHLFFFVFILFKPENMKSAAASNFVNLWKSALLSFQDILLTEIYFFFRSFLDFIQLSADQETVNIPDFQIIK